MPELTIDLADHIYEQLTSQAHDRGLTVEEGAKVILGQAVTNGPNGENAPDDVPDHEVAILLAPRVQDRLTRGGELMGLPLDLFCTMILGKAAYSDWVQVPKPMLPLSEILGDDWMDTFQQIMGLMNVYGGAATCPHCTQRVDVESYKSGVCRHCELSITDAS